jgi:hypothetical protein
MRMVVANPLDVSLNIANVATIGSRMYCMHVIITHHDNLHVICYYTTYSADNVNVTPLVLVIVTSGYPGKVTTKFSTPELPTIELSVWLNMLV